MVVTSEPMRELKELLGKVARGASATVLVSGETGTGKDLVAHEIHRHSSRDGGPFQSIACSVLPETLMESELFGHEPGAFTDARRRKKGLVELAKGGTLFLDEIGELSNSVQVKLLTFLEHRVFRRLGGTREMTVDTRIIAATNQDLEEVEADLVIQALEQTQGNQTRAGQLLGLTRHQIHYRMEKLGLSSQDGEWTRSSSTGRIS